MTKVRYVASEGQGDVTVEGVRFRANPEQSVQDVPDALAKELLSGKSVRFDGLNFEDAEPAPKKPKAAKKPKAGESTTGSDT